MISPQFFIEKLKANHIDFFAGVPDSLLKNMCAYITDHFDAAHNIIAANEGAAVGLAAGHYLATGQPACVYMQNSGEGNAINPLASQTRTCITSRYFSSSDGAGNRAYTTSLNT